MPTGQPREARCTTRTYYANGASNTLGRHTHESQGRSNYKGIEGQLWRVDDQERHMAPERRTPASVSSSLSFLPCQARGRILIPLLAGEWSAWRAI